MFSEKALTRTVSRNARGQKNQRGITLMLVLFILIVVSLLAAAMARLNQGGSNAVSMEVQSTRALFAAESGAQIAAIQLFPINGNMPGCGNVTTPKTFSVGGLNSCSANLTCVATNAAGRTVYTVTSEGRCNVGSNDYARRRITIGLRSL